MLNITDLCGGERVASRDLDRREMGRVRGGSHELERLGALIDFSTIRPMHFPVCVRTHESLLYIVR